MIYKQLVLIWDINTHRLWFNFNQTLINNDTTHQIFLLDNNKSKVASVANLAEE